MKLKCSICESDYEFEYNKEKPLPVHFPFCSKRCKTIDLAKWLNEEYRISTPLTENDQLADFEQMIIEDFDEETLSRMLDKEINKV